MSKVSQNLFINSVHDKTAEYDNPWYKRYAVPLTLAGAGAAGFLGAKLFRKLALRNANKYYDMNHDIALSDEARKAAWHKWSQWAGLSQAAKAWGQGAVTTPGVTALGFGAYQGYKDIID